MSKPRSKTKKTPPPPPEITQEQREAWEKVQRTGEWSDYQAALQLEGRQHIKHAGGPDWMLEGFTTYINIPGAGVTVHFTKSTLEVPPAPDGAGPSTVQRGGYLVRRTK